MPEFETLAGGKIIKISGGFGTDYVFLSGEPAAAKGSDVAFEGTSGSVQDRSDGVVLSLGAGGKVQYREISLACEGAASLRLDPAEHVEIALPAEHTALRVDVSLPGNYRLAAEAPGGVELTEKKAAGAYVLAVPAGVGRVKLSPR